MSPGKFSKVNWVAELSVKGGRRYSGISKTVQKTAREEEPLNRIGRRNQFQGKIFHCEKNEFANTAFEIPW